MQVVVSWNQRQFDSDCIGFRMKAKSRTLCIVNGNLCGGVWCSNTVYFRGRRLGFVEFLLRLKVIDWLAEALSLVWSLTGALTLMWPHLPSLLVPAPRNKRSEPE